MEKAGALP